MKEKPTIIDLFCGVGGFSLGAVRAGFELKGSVDWDVQAINSHTINFPGAAHWRTDISTLSGKDLLDRFNVRTVDGIIGGPPCQGFSRMGHQRPEDKRNELFIKFFDLVSQISPKFFLAENVQGILDVRNKPLIDKALSAIRDKYIVVGPLTINARDCGAPTTRTRVFFYGYQRKYMKSVSALDLMKRVYSSSRVRVADALFGLPRDIKPYVSKYNSLGWRKVRKITGRSFFSSRIQGCIPLGVGDAVSIQRMLSRGKVSGNQGTFHTEEVKKRFRLLKQGKQDQVSRARKLELNGYCHTIRAGTGSDMGSFQALRPIHPTSSRVITPREAARLQGFPDWFQFNKTKWHSFRQIGNSVCPIVSERILRAIKNYIRR